MLNDVLHNPGPYTNGLPFVYAPYVYGILVAYQNVTPVLEKRTATKVVTTVGLEKTVELLRCIVNSVHKVSSKFLGLNEALTLPGLW